MALKIKTSLLVLLLLHIFLSSGIAEGFSDSMNHIYSVHKDGFPMNSRKLLVLDRMLDYDYAGPNPKHDPSPRKGKPGGGNGRNA
ncbi:hypothetical protein F0562_030983 [Nyssa sinensis]|uniref:Uncharacterized protein n=1 Tax=Nyssa sinensis TaxID=561372 RepID=A0A5J5ARF7_9ASTE|nr:hypothetical protein F0562_030983 [Nyssa sinensis]